MTPILQTELGRDNAIRDQRKFGRRYAPDARDFQHPMVGAIRQMPKKLQKRRSRAPGRGPTLDQGNTPLCVKYSAATALGAAPLRYATTPDGLIEIVNKPVDGYGDLYEYAQNNDEWPGDSYEGTSVRAGQQYLVKAELSTGFVWARNLDEMKDYISREGSTPIIIGIDYTEGMETPKKIKGKYYLEPTGAVVGGHAMCVLWFSPTLKAWVLQQTWGPEFGDDGIVHLTDEAMDILVFRWNGEATSFTERRKAA